MSKLFTYCLGNPPYQQQIEKQGDRAQPVYHEFMEAAFQVADTVELITPARFLFNAGQTPKTWNNKMLSDPHFKVLDYESDASKVFPNTDIKGGVAVSIRSSNTTYGAITKFTPYPQLNSILTKVMRQTTEFVDSIVSSRGMYRFSDVFYADYPEAKDRLSTGTGNMVVSNILDVMTQTFTSSEPNDHEEHLCIYGRTNNKRVQKYILRKYIVSNEYIDKYKVMLPEGNGTGRFGEKLTAPFVANPGEGSTDTYISMGTFSSRNEAESLAKYINTKFARAMLGVNKATQHSSKSVWVNVPLQDFTAGSDIDWSKPISEIDQQLYRKYGLDEAEISFIETNVKEMS